MAHLQKHCGRVELFTLMLQEGWADHSFAHLFLQTFPQTHPEVHFTPPVGCFSPVKLTIKMKGHSDQMEPPPDASTSSSYWLALSKGQPSFLGPRRVSLFREGGFANLGSVFPSPGSQADFQRLRCPLELCFWKMLTAASLVTQLSAVLGLSHRAEVFMAPSSITGLCGI